jgi:hypothetical protein
VAALELVDGIVLGDERDGADAPDLAGRAGHLEETMGHDIDRDPGKGEGR